MFAHRHRECFAGSVHTGDSALRADSALGEHIRLGLQLLVFIEIFQRAEQIIGGILLKQSCIATIVKQTMLCSEGIVGSVQTRLRFLHSRIRVIVQLLLNQLVYDLPQFHHSGDTGFGSVR